MKTFSYEPRPQIRCDCCGAMATRKGGCRPFFLCAACALLPDSEIAERKSQRYMGKPAAETYLRDHWEGRCEDCKDEAYVRAACGSGVSPRVGLVLEGP